MTGASDYDWAGFRGIVREYESVLTGATDSEFQVFRERCKALLARLFYEGTRMPTYGDVYTQTGGDEEWDARDEEDNPEVSEWLARWREYEPSLSEYLGERNVFYVANPEAEEAWTATLSDTLADVLSDLQTGATHWDAGRLPEAMWEWTFSFDHWGEHALDAMKAMHWRVDWMED